jgi:hypothetical protein
MQEHPPWLGHRRSRTSDGQRLAFGAVGIADLTDLRSGLIEGRRVTQRPAGKEVGIERIGAVRAGLPRRWRCHLRDLIREVVGGFG